MKKLIRAGSAFAALALALPAAYAATSVETKTATVGATIAGVNTFTLAVKNMNHTAATGITFAGVSSVAPAWTSKASQYIQLSVNDNALAWELRNYTDNFNFAGGVLPSTTVWGHQYGGLKGTVAGQRAGLGWAVLPDTGVVQFNGPDAGDPVLSSTNGWTFVKDRSDRAPGLSPDATGPGAEATFAGSGGYKNIAFGGISDTRIVRPNLPGGTEALSSRTAPFFYFLGANFNGVAPGDYNTTIIFELLNL